MSPIYRVKAVPQPPYQCENEDAGHQHQGSLYEVSWTDEEGEPYYFIECYSGLKVWLKTVQPSMVIHI